MGTSSQFAALGSLNMEYNQVSALVSFVCLFVCLFVCFLERENLIERERCLFSGFNTFSCKSLWMCVVVHSVFVRHLLLDVSIHKEREIALFTCTLHMYYCTNVLHMLTTVVLPRQSFLVFFD